MTLKVRKNNNFYGLVMLPGPVKDHIRPLLHHVVELPLARGQISEIAFHVPGKARGVLLLELVKHLAVAVYPAGSLRLESFVSGVHPVLVLEPRYGNIELERADRAEYVVVADDRPEDLHSALFSQLREPLLELLGLHRVSQYDPSEVLSGEVRYAGELQRLLFSKGVADFDRPVVMYAYDVARKGLFHIGPVLRHEYGRVRQDKLLAYPVVHDFHAPVKPSRAYPYEGYPVPVGRVHVRLYLESKPGKWPLVRRHEPLDRLPRTRGRGQLPDTGPH